MVKLGNTLLKQQRKTNLYCTTKLQKCSMVELGDALVQHKKKNQSFVELPNCNNVQWKILKKKRITKL